MTTQYRHRDLSIDQLLALTTAAVNLQRGFDGVFGAETIERFLHSSYDEFAGRAVVLNHLPLLAERFARQRLTALARVEGKHKAGVPVMLFLCTHNAGRSQMALGFFTHLAGDRATVWSGGTKPADRINPAAVAAMAERGIDIAGEYPKPLDQRDRTPRAGPARGDGGPHPCLTPQPATDTRPARRRPITRMWRR